MMTMGSVESGRAQVRHIPLADDLDRLSSRMSRLRRSQRIDCPGKHNRYTPARRVRLGLV